MECSSEWRCSSSVDQQTNIQEIPKVDELWIWIDDHADVLSILLLDSLLFQNVCVVSYHLTTKIGYLGVDCMELCNHDRTYKSFVLTCSPKFQYVDFSLSSFHSVEPSVCLIYVLVFIVCVTFIFVVEPKETNNFLIINFLVLPIDIISVISLPLVDGFLLHRLDLRIVVEHLKFGIESMFIFYR